MIPYTVVNDNTQLRIEIASLKQQLADAQKVIVTINSLRSDALEIFSGSHTQAELDVIEWYSASIDAAISAQKESP